MKKINTYGLTAEQVYNTLDDFGKYFFNVANEQYEKGSYTDGIINTVQAAYDLVAQFYSVNGGKLVDNAVDGDTFVRTAEKK